MVYTRAEGWSDLVHILMNVFSLGTTSFLERALDKHGIIVADDVHWMDNDVIKTLTYDDDQGNEMPLPKSYQFLIIILQHYYVHCKNEGQPIGDDWLTINANEFNKFRINADRSLHCQSQMHPPKSNFRQSLVLHFFHLLQN